MTHTDARILITNIEHAAAKNHVEFTWSDLKAIERIRARFASDSKITKQESNALQDLYKRAAGGGFKSQSMKLSDMLIIE